MEAPLTVAIIAGGLTHERDISMNSGRRMAQLLRDAGMHVKLFDVDARLLPALQSMSPDVVWPLVHGSTGEDGSLQDLLLLAGYPYVGSMPFACRMSADKSTASNLLRSFGVHTPEAMTLPQALFREVGVSPVLELLSNRFTFPLVVKPNHGGSALGVTIVEHGSQLARAMIDCFAYDNEARIEQFIDGEEVAVCVMKSDDGLHALPSIRIRTDGPYDFDARYNAGRAEYFIPSSSDYADEKTLSELAVNAHRLLNLGTYSRIDMIATNDGNVYVIDVNVAPGCTETSLFPQAVAAEAENRHVPIEVIYREILSHPVS